jgi:hypothetical protein
VTELLRLPIRMHGILLARPVDALIDARVDRVVGLEILCGDGARRFLPYAVADVRNDEIAVASALTLLDERDLDYYRPRTRRVAELAFADPWVDEHGVVHDVADAA